MNCTGHVLEHVLVNIRECHVLVKFYSMYWSNEKAHAGQVKGIHWSNEKVYTGQLLEHVLVK